MARWERSINPSLILHQKSKSILETVFLQLAHVEAEKLSGEEVHSAAVMIDLSNYYEHISITQLQSRAKELGFPESLLPLMINIYQARRLTSMYGLAQMSKFPSRGIPAGCTFATFLVQVICYLPLTRWQKQFPRTPGGMFIDDLMIRALGNSYKEIISNMVPSVKAIHHMVTVELQCTIAEHKTAVVASHPKLQAQLHEALGSLGGSLSPGAASNLGIDYSSGALRCLRLSRKQLRVRFQKLKRRRARLRALKSSGVSTLTLWKTASIHMGTMARKFLVNLTTNFTTLRPSTSAGPEPIFRHDQEPCP